LNALVPGRAYWLQVERETVLPDRFSISSPVPVSLKQGWNDFVYLGGPADYRDALGSIAGRYLDLYSYEGPPGDGRWRWSGRADTPAWARGFLVLEPCRAYQLFVDADSTLSPLTP
jgi:hypothetical protein